MNKLRLAVTAFTLSTALYLGFVPLQSDGQSHKAHGETSPVAGQQAQPTPSLPQGDGIQQQDEFNLQVKTWIDSLSVQKGFNSWKTAVWSRYPLGPGTHGWIVLLQSSKQEELGYLVISATTDGKWSLTEYGVGPSPLFSMNSLYRSLVQQELIPDTYTFDQFIANSNILSALQRLYYSPLHAVWQVTIQADGQPIRYYLDAKTGEQLPLADDSFTKWLDPDSSATAFFKAPSDLIQEVELPSFDPFHNTYWLQGIPLEVVDFGHLQSALQQQASIAYVAKLFNKRITAPFAVTGYAVWSGSEQPFIRLEQEGARYIPLKELLDNGFFFP